MIGFAEHSPEEPAPLRFAGLAGGVFRPAGVLQSALSLEHRAPQERMARAVTRALRESGQLLCEAGTGVGKSLAYLVPSLLFAWETKRQAVVSTHTIALQEQLLHSDLPICRRLFQSDPALRDMAAFREALLVGRGNYLCGTRLAQALGPQTELFAEGERGELARIAAWSQTTQTGLLQELNPAPPSEVWEWVNADSSACSRKHCSPENCFFRRARAKVREAHVVIVNHSLLFALLAAGVGPGDGKPGFLTPDDFLILDEAHTLPDVATEHFGARLTSRALTRLLSRLWHPGKKRGLLKTIGTRREHEAVERAVDGSHLFFGHLHEELLGRKPLVRLHQPEWAPALLREPLAELAAHLGNLEGRLADGPPLDELKDSRKQVLAWQAGLDQALALADPGHVYWAERGGTTRFPNTLLRSAPLDLAASLRSVLFSNPSPLVLTSATLAEGGKLDLFRERTGAREAVGLVEPSPFDYERHMRVFIAGDSPSPTAENGALDDTWLADYITFCTLRIAGGSLVLFTSHQTLRKAADACGPHFAQAGRTFLRQEPGRSRHALVQEMRAGGNAILFGTDTFWTGVDIPGRALSQVIITRLPFESPGHPVSEARAELLQEKGRSPFAELTLPDALMQFRQGVGRLIRTASDQGVVTLLDSRILQKNYGKRFLAQLPQPRHTVMTKQDRTRLFPDENDRSPPPSTRK